MVWVASILMNLSKAYDCQPHDLIITRLEAYGLSKASPKLLNDYFNKYYQCPSIDIFKAESFKGCYRHLSENNLLSGNTILLRQPISELLKLEIITKRKLVKFHGTIY